MVGFIAAVSACQTRTPTPSGCSAEAADDESREEEKGKLRAAADVLGGMARDVAVGVITARLGT